MVSLDAMPCRSIGAVGGEEGHIPLGSGTLQEAAGSR